jgi:hypothetical protein
MSGIPGNFVQIQRPGFTTPPHEGPGEIVPGDTLLLQGGRERPIIANGAGCGCALVGLVVGLGLGLLVMELGWDFTRVRRGTQLIAMVCIALMMGAFGVGQQAVKAILGRRALKVRIPRASLDAIEVQGRHVVLSWHVGDEKFLAFFSPVNQPLEVVAQALRLG